MLRVMQSPHFQLKTDSSKSLESDQVKGDETVASIMLAKILYVGCKKKLNQAILRTSF